MIQSQSDFEIIQPINIAGDPKADYTAQAQWMVPLLLPTNSEPVHGSVLRELRVFVHHILAKILLCQCSRIGGDANSYFVEWISVP